MCRLNSGCPIHHDPAEHASFFWTGGDFCYMGEWVKGGLAAGIDWHPGLRSVQYNLLAENIYYYLGTTTS